MKKLLITLALVLAIMVPVSAKPVPASVHALSWTTVSVASDDDGDLEMAEASSEVRNHCSIWPYVTPAGKHYYITAAHCVMNEGMTQLEDHDFQIDGLPVAVASYEADHDLAAMTGGPVSEGYQISARSPQVKDRIHLYGHPFGFDEIFYQEGVISSLRKTFNEDKSVYVAYQMPSAPGDSGSPVFDRDDKVIGVLQVGFCGGLFWQGFCPEAGGSPLYNLRMFLSKL